MTDKKLTILGIVAAIMVLLVVIQSGSDKQKQSDADTIKYLIQGLNPSDIHAFEIKSNDETVNITKQGDNFVIKQLSNYPAKIAQINELITKCLDIKVGKVYTSEPKNFADLGVAEDSARYIVKFFNKDGDIITGTIVSEFKDGKTYARRIDSDNVYSTTESFWLNSSAKNFAQQQITEIKTENITSVEVKTDSDQYTIEKIDGKNTLLNIPQGKKAKDSEINSVFRAASSLRFDDVIKEDQAKDLKFNSTYVCKLDNSTVYTISIAKSDDKTFAKLKADFTDTTPVTIAREAESEEELRKKEAKLLANEAAIKFTKNHSGWIYQLPSYAAGNLTKSFDSLVEDEPKPEKEQEDKASEQATEQTDDKVAEEEKTTAEQTD